MSYQSIALMAEDNDLRKRIVACASTQETIAYPWGWVDERMWKFAAEPGWGEAYQSAVVANIERPGWNEGVITDAMILSSVQAMNANPTPV